MARGKHGKILIAGGSLGGLFAAAILLRHGFEVAVFEQTRTELASRGAGIVTHAELLSAVEEATGKPIPADIGVLMDKRSVIDTSCRVIQEIPFHQIATSWDRLFQILRRAVPDDCYRLGKRLVDFEETAAGITAVFADGSRETGDMLVGADGIRSAVRSRVAPEAEPEYAGYVAWRGLIEESALSEATRAVVKHDFVFSMPPGEQALVYPVAGLGRDAGDLECRLNVVWYRPAHFETKLASMLTDDNGTRHNFTIPPPLISRATLAEMRADATRLIAPPLAEIMHRATLPLLQPIYDLTIDKMVFGRAVLIGDAAFVARPHVGAGVTKAAQDALALCDALKKGGSVQDLRDLFDKPRIEAGHRYVNRARDLGACVDAQLSTPRPPPSDPKFLELDTILVATGSIAF